jgi:hypothetical protein
LAARELAARAKGIVDAGGAVVEILATVAFNVQTPPTKAQLDSWITSGNLTCSSFIDATGFTAQTINLFKVRERAVVVELSTMKVVWHGDGDQGGGSANNSVVLGSQEILRLLGP